jgi:alpha-beta hydrolase superfamily lysophospholipase
VFVNVSVPQPRARGLLGWVRRHPWRSLALCLPLALVVLLNVLAYRQARSMTTFYPAGTVGRRSVGARGLAELLVNGLQIERRQNQETPADRDLPYERVALTAGDGSGVEGWWISPPRPRATVVLLHGYAASKQALLTLAEAFHARGFGSLLIDFRGAGGSAGDQTSVGFHEAHDAAAALDWARQQGRPVIAYGVSMGAAAVMRAVHLGLAQPDALVLEAPFNRFVDTVRNRFDMLGVPSFPTADLLVFYGGLLTEADALSHDPVTYAQDVRCPTLILHGAQDNRVTVPQATEVLDALAAEDKALHVFPDLGHTRFCRKAPSDWWAALSPFLERALPRAPGR